MAVVPLIFLIQPLVSVFALDRSASGALGNEHVLLYMLILPAIVPAFVAAYAVVGERQQATLEPVLTTPIPREEFLLGKALACLVPSVVIAYAVYAIFLALIVFFADRSVAAAVIRGPDLLAQIVFTPLLAGLVDLARHGDLCAFQGRQGRAAAGHAREPPDGRGGGAHRPEPDPRHARPCRRRCRGAAGARWSGLADHFGGVRPGKARHRHQVIGADRHEVIRRRPIVDSARTT